MKKNIYHALTDEFNLGRTRTVITSGQAAVLHRVALMSKDGDWIVREDDEALSFVLNVLQRHGATYRFGAPLDTRWLSGGWSAHFEFVLKVQEEAQRIRTDFFSKPPRLTSSDLTLIWDGADQQTSPPYVSAEVLGRAKLTMRAKDYAVIGELARVVESPKSKLRLSRSGLEILELAANFPAEFAEVCTERPALALASAGRDALDRALLEEQFQLMRADEARLKTYSEAGQVWRRTWTRIEPKLKGMPLLDAHKIVVTEALQHLPFAPLA